MAIVSVITTRINSLLTPFLSETTVTDNPELYYVWNSSAFIFTLTEAELNLRGPEGTAEGKKDNTSLS